MPAFADLATVKAGWLRRSWAPRALGSVHMHAFAPYKTNLVLSYITNCIIFPFLSDSLLPPPPHPNPPF
jgi:hypothetical protein